MPLVGNSPNLWGAWEQLTKLCGAWWATREDFKCVKLPRVTLWCRTCESPLGAREHSHYLWGTCGCLGVLIATREALREAPGAFFVVTCEQLARHPRGTPNQLVLLCNFLERRSLQLGGNSGLMWPGLNMETSNLYVCVLIRCCVQLRFYIPWWGYIHKPYYISDVILGEIKLEMKACYIMHFQKVEVSMLITDSTLKTQGKPVINMEIFNPWI